MPEPKASSPNPPPAPDKASRPWLEPAPPSDPAVGFRWLLRLRMWGSLGGIAVILATAFLVGAPLPVSALVGGLGLLLLTNLVLQKTVKQVRPLTMGGVLTFDILLLTGLLALSGGPSNPFGVLYLVYVAVAATVLGPGWTWAMAVLAVAAYGALFGLVPSSASMHHPTAPTDGVASAAFDLHLYGMFVAFALAAALIAYVVTRVTAALRARDRALTEAREQIARSEQLASLTTLAAGAAHELGTPLATIAVTAGELARQSEGDDRWQKDAQLIRDEVTRCRQILDRMSASEIPGEGLADVSVRSLVEAVTQSIGAERAKRLEVRLDGGQDLLRVPPQAFARALTDLVRNAFDASAPEDSVLLSASSGTTMVRFSVQDRGHGMTEHDCRRAVEPFFTTKDTGQGMGLGLFLARALTDDLGGHLRIHSRVREGTVATVEVPR